MIDRLAKMDETRRRQTIRVVADPGQRHNGGVAVCDHPGCGWEASSAAPSQEHYLTMHAMETGHMRGTIYNDRAYTRVFATDKKGPR